MMRNPNRPFFFPAEKIILCAALLAGAGFSAGLPLVHPASKVSEVVGRLTEAWRDPWLVIPSLVTFAIIWYALIHKGKKENTRQSQKGRSGILVRHILCLAATSYLMQCFKWWSLLQMRNYDAFYMKTDRSLAWVGHVFEYWHGLVQIPQSYYFSVFGLSFVFCYIIAAVAKPEIFVRMVTAGVAVSILGGIAYGFFPAYGPLVYSLAQDESVAGMQRHMVLATEQFQQSRGKVFSPEYFEMVLGAMPSLHVAQMVVLGWFSYRVHRFCGLLMTACALFIVCYAVITRFHYIIDLPAGFFLGLISIQLTEYLHRHEHRI